MPHKRRCHGREWLFRQGEECREVVVVARGIVSLRQLDRAGAVATISHAGTGRLLDCRALMARARHMADARSQRGAQVCCAPADAVRSLIASGGPAVSEFIEQAGDQLEAANLAGQLRSHRSAVTRVCLALRMLTEAHGRRGDDGWHLDLPLNRIELATLVGARPETISRTIGILERSGLAHFSGRHVDIPSLELLGAEGIGGED